MWYFNIVLSLVGAIIIHEIGHIIALKYYGINFTFNIIFNLNKISFILNVPNSVIPNSISIIIILTSGLLAQLIYIIILWKYYPDKYILSVNTILLMSNIFLPETDGWKIYRLLSG